MVYIMDKEAVGIFVLILLSGVMGLILGVQV